MQSKYQCKLADCRCLWRSGCIRNIYSSLTAKRGLRINTYIWTVQIASIWCRSSPQIDADESFPQKRRVEHVLSTFHIGIHDGGVRNWSNALPWHPNCVASVNLLTHSDVVGYSFLLIKLNDKLEKPVGFAQVCTRTLWVNWLWCILTWRILLNEDVANSYHHQPWVETAEKSIAIPPYFSR